MNQKISISRLAIMTQVNLETLRSLKRRGLIDAPVRLSSGLRSYGPADVRRILFIKRAQLLGFSLDQIGRLLTLEDARPDAETRELAARKLGMVESKLDDLIAMQQALTAIVGRCDVGNGERGGAIIQALVED
ncbi:MerR family DNA-binding protein [Paraherbaspirillum soli]|uniref:MerR family DNA-binding protein n=1 Tax=Paraherbaspirillum soli TaxID=631222 RepID=A0ABW0M9Q0_9BURK